MLTGTFLCQESSYKLCPHVLLTPSLQVFKTEMYVAFKKSIIRIKQGENKKENINIIYVVCTK